jgi:hypothetical protein
MYRKINARKLLILVVILLLLVGGLTLKDYFKGDRSYRTYVLKIDTAQVTSLSISTTFPNSAIVKLFLDQKSWKASMNGNIYSADPAIINNLLTDLAQMKIESLAGTSRNNWSEFQVNDSTAIKVSIQEKGKNKNKVLFIGKFSYQQPTNPYDRQGRMSSYVRLVGEDETYSVQGFLRMSFSPDVNNYRNKFLTKTNANLFSKLTFTYPGDSSFTLIKQSKNWQIGGIPVDSAKLVKYFNDLEQISCYEFADSVKHDFQASFTLNIEGAGLPSPIELKAFQTISAKGYLIHSSYNPEGLFNGSLGELVTKIFKGKKSFFK